MVLVWPRSTKPLEGSTMKPWCCKDVTLSRLNSTVCGHWSCCWTGGTQLPGGSGLGLREPSSSHPLSLQQAAQPTRIMSKARQARAAEGQGRRGSAVVTFFGDSCVVRMQLTCSSRVAGGAGVSVSS